MGSEIIICGVVVLLILIILLKYGKFLILISLALLLIGFFLKLFINNNDHSTNSCDKNDRKIDDPLDL